MGFCASCMNIIQWLINKIRIMSSSPNWIIILDHSQNSFINHSKFLPEHLIAFLCQHEMLPLQDWREIKEQVYIFKVVAGFKSTIN